MCPNFESGLNGRVAANKPLIKDTNKKKRLAFANNKSNERLSHLRQETGSAQDFALEFRTLAAGAGWNDRALMDHYRCSLREDVRRELACRDATRSLDELIDMSIRQDNLLAARGRPERVLLVSPPGLPAPIPMELGGAA